MRRNRRGFLGALGLAGLGGLSGCQEKRPQTATDTQSTESPPPTRTASPTASATPTQTEADQSPTVEPGIDVETSVDRTERKTLVRVSGEVVTGSPIVGFIISVGTEQLSEEVDQTRSLSFNEEVEVKGGREYEVTVQVDTTDTELTARDTTGYVSVATEGLNAKRLVGAHYYPWYEMNGGHQNWTDDCVAEPVLGEYAADEESVIDQHLTWCLDHGINWLSVSWWGEGSGSDRALSDGLLQSKKFDQLSFSILYETTRLEKYNYDLDADATRDFLIKEFRYLEEQFFGRDNYLHIDGRPVIFFWISHALEGDARAAFNTIDTALETELYVLAGVPFGRSLGTAPMTAAADGITSYNPYTPRPDIEEVFHESYTEGLQTMNLATRASDLDFFPPVISGFNDTAIPDSQREDNPVLTASPKRYERVCRQVQPHLADSQAVLITSFNEWYENTQIEPNEKYGTAYLETTADRLATAESGGYDPTGEVLRLVFNETVVPADSNPDSSDDRQLAFMADSLTIYDGTERLVHFDIGDVEHEPIFLSGVYSVGSSEEMNWRWFGGTTAETSIFVPTSLTGADRAVLRGQPMGSGEITASVYFRGKQTDRVKFGERRMRDFELEL